MLFPLCFCFRQTFFVFFQLFPKCISFHFKVSLSLSYFFIFPLHFFLLLLCFIQTRLKIFFFFLCLRQTFFVLVNFILHFTHLLFIDFDFFFHVFILFHHLFQPQSKLISFIL